MDTDTQAPLTCRQCGQPISWNRRRDRYMHRSRGVVAACDLDADHLVTPDWSALGEVPCRVCGTPLAPRGEDLSHVDRARDADHEPDPQLPGVPPPT